MNLTSIPIITVSSFILGELYKAIFQKIPSAYKFIPVFSTLIGGVLGVVMYYTAPMMISSSNVWDALMIGFCSGGSATACNQIVKQIIVKPIREAKEEGYSQAVNDISNEIDNLNTENKEDK